MIPWAHPSPQPKRHLDLFNRFCTDDCRVSLNFTMGRPFPPQNCPFPRGIWSPFNTWFPGPTRVLNPDGISIGLVVFAGPLVWQTDRQTDHDTRSVTIGRIYAGLYVVLRCGLKLRKSLSFHKLSNNRMHDASYGRNHWKTSNNMNFSRISEPIVPVVRFVWRRRGKTR